MTFTPAQRNAGHIALAKYRIHSQDDLGQTIWWARVPYGTYRRFSSWSEAAAVRGGRSDGQRADEA